MTTAAPDDAPAADDAEHLSTVVLPRRELGSSLPIGHRLQEFVIEQVLGEGGFSIVYLVRDTRLGRLVAIKEYIPSTHAYRAPHGEVAPRSERHRETFELGLRSFLNEAQLLGSFDHPSLVKVYRFWEENGTAYMVMPYYEGPTLKKWLADLGTPPSEAWLRALAAPLINVLEQIHADQCYHRDLAPDNMLLLVDRGAGAFLEQKPRPLLLDFGAARRVIGDATQLLTVILKPGYAPIEQYAQTTTMRQGPWTDVYALCAVLYAAVTGRAPPTSVDRILADEMVPATLAAVGRYSPQFLSAIDIGLAVRPELRPQSMSELRRHFDAPVLVDTTPVPSVIAAPVQVDAPTPMPPAPDEPRVPEVGDTPPPQGKSTRLANIAIVAGATVASLIAMAWWLGRDTQLNAPPLQAEKKSAPTVMPITNATPTSTPFGIVTALQDMVARADPTLTVRASADKATLTIGRDPLRLHVKSSQAGFLYLFLAGTDKSHFYLLFPNQRDKNNRIEADQEIALPRPPASFIAGGPAGTNHLVAMVSRHERDFSDTGLRALSSGSIPEFDLGVAQQRWTEQRGRGNPFAGKAVCSGQTGCDERYGATLIEIVEVAVKP